MHVLNQDLILFKHHLIPIKLDRGLAIDILFKALYHTKVLICFAEI
jgi:hypothetical protein